MEQNNFSVMDIRFIQKYLSKMTDEEIADMLDKPVHVVTPKIAEITGVSKIESFQQKQAKKSAEKSAQKAVIQSAKRKDDLAKREKQKLHQQRAEALQATKLRKQRQEQPLFKTRVIDYSQLIAVRIDAKTTVYAKPGEDVAEVRKNFLRKATVQGTAWKFRAGNNH